MSNRAKQLPPITQISVLRSVRKPLPPAVRVLQDKNKRNKRLNRHQIDEMRLT